MIRILTILCVILIVVLGGGWLVLNFLRPAVSVTEVVEGPVVQAFYSTGSIEPVREYPIKSNTDGLLSEVRVDKGDHVVKGQILAIVEDPILLYKQREAEAILNEKQKRGDPKNSPVLQEIDAKLAGATSQLEIADREQKRVTDLMEHNAGTQTDLDRAMDRVRQLTSDAESDKAQRVMSTLEMQREVDVAKAALDAAEWNVRQQTLTAPIDGVILDRPLALRTRVAINDPIMRLADVSVANLVMRAAVDEEDVAKVRIQQTVRMTLYAFPGKAFHGTVEKIYDQADADRRTFEVDVRISEDIPRLQPGMTGELAFVIDEKPKAMVIPAQAVQSDDSVFVVHDGRMVREYPTLGLRSIERVEVLSGLQSGDQIVISALKADEVNRAIRATHVDSHVAAGLNKASPIDQPVRSFEK